MSRMRTPSKEFPPGTMEQATAKYNSGDIQALVRASSPCQDLICRPIQVCGPFPSSRPTLATTSVAHERIAHFGHRLAGSYAASLIAMTQGKTRQARIVLNVESHLPVSGPNSSERLHMYLSICICVLRTKKFGKFELDRRPRRASWA